MRAVPPLHLPANLRPSVTARKRVDVRTADAIPGGKRAAQEGAGGNCGAYFEYLLGGQFEALVIRHRAAIDPSRCPYGPPRESGLRHAYQSKSLAFCFSSP